MIMVKLAEERSLSPSLLIMMHHGRTLIIAVMRTGTLGMPQVKLSGGPGRPRSNLK